MSPSSLHLLLDISVCFHVSVIAVNVGVWLFFETLFSLPFDTHLEVGWPGDVVVLLFRFAGASTLFSLVATMHSRSLSCFLPALVNWSRLGDCHSTGVKRFAFPWWLEMLTIFSWTCWPWNRHFGKLSAQFLCRFSFWPHLLACGILVPQPGIEPMPWAVNVWSAHHWAAETEFLTAVFKLDFFFVLSCMISLYIWDTNPLSRNMVCKFFLPFYKFPFHFCWLLLLLCISFKIWCSPTY